MNAAVCCNAVRIGIGEAGIGFLWKMKIILLPKVVCGEWRSTFLLLPDCGEVFCLVYDVRVRVSRFISREHRRGRHHRRQQ